MKILLSAYACAPGRGSEHGVGWNWAVELNKLSHDVHVLTRTKNAAKIASDNAGDDINFVYYDLPKVIIKLKKVIGTHLYYTLWQYFAYRLLIKKYNKNYFDVVHHITFVSFRFPTFIYKLGGKFILGPIGGGEEGTPTLIKSLPITYQFLEYFRIFCNKANKYNILINTAYKSAHEIYVTTQATYDKIPLKFQCKTKIAPAIGIDNKHTISELRNKNEFVILFAGNLLHWKGIHLAIKVFAYIKDFKSNVVLKIVGNGPFQKYLVKLVSKLKLSGSVIFIQSIPQDELFKIYQTSDLFLFPSFHDSGGFVVLEAMAYGLPVICINQGGPSNIVGENSANVINIDNKNINQIIQLLATRLKYFIDNPGNIQCERSFLQCRVLQYSWQNIINNVYKLEA